VQNIKNLRPQGESMGIPERILGFRVSKREETCRFSVMTDGESAAKSAKCRVKTAGTKLSRRLTSNELEQQTRWRKRNGLQRGEFIRQLILDELARDSGDPPVSPELVEIIGLRLMLTNLLKPLTTGQKITPEVFDGTIAEVKKHKRSLAIKTRTDLEKA
jgi:hypothetical protein